MGRKIIGLTLCMLVCFSVISINITTSKVEMKNEENVLPVMQVDNEFIEKYQYDYNNEEAAYIDCNLAYETQTTSDYSILDLLYFIIEERTGRIFLAFSSSSRRCSSSLPYLTQSRRRCSGT